MKSLILDFLKNKFKENDFVITEHFLMREQTRGRYSNLILYLKESLETLELKKRTIDFSSYNNGCIVIFDEHRLFKLVLEKEDNLLKLITVIHGAKIKENGELIIRVNTRELPFLKESKIINEYKNSRKRLVNVM
ncbi:hypothetical protein GW796_08090 [archaeon]|nr:hypothetical protein [archaeon]